MARWKPLPDELDPRMAEFVVHMRRSVDRSGLSATALAERTGYSRTSWERFLDGRLLAPRRAVDAFAEATGTSPVHLTTLWELAEQSWSPGSHDPVTTPLRVPPTALPTREVGGPTEGNSWGLAGYKGPSRVGGSGENGGNEAVGAGGSGEGRGKEAVEYGSSVATAVRSETGVKSIPRLLTFVAGALGVVALAGAAFLLTDSGPGDTPVAAADSPSPSTSSRPALPPGVKCSGPTCTGKDAEAMGCADDLVTTTTSARVAGARVEVRYSRTCGAAWGRIVRAGPGDVVQVAVGKVRQRGEITVAGDTSAYTPMVAVRTPGEARACAELASGRRGCTG
ncbi:DUF2690 domain-containing protein [Streptomyces niveiscabiei]|uniref:helix-turn-helix domain-containing protein n=1 Tax=Streptomyces niveiscabiei TaxID=164115 RepID=UPI0029A12967|nr:DUF2690 domain-containing protein [Streptomyces niveiscabiei]MDX3384557.1 DUF2690 domain-containing protein [Streptomyces niveiscabiei]